eukprot:comp8045_c0_seq1/m.3548 comp8045_c0_seq1/g.3548  ORF comp8045_c0_seq1/g.3548 comp8045_c0_seq1/m.3548 type:complete len:124 (-) comp8045_c0_seq1:790-1161(-)
MALVSSLAMTTVSSTAARIALYSVASTLSARAFCTRCYPTQKEAKKPVLTRAEGEELGYVKEPVVLYGKRASSNTGDKILAAAMDNLYPTPHFEPEELPTSWRKGFDKAVNSLSENQKRHHVA